jgi:ABC-type transport system involved in multi-copper enzyme maturation permease subunit
MRGLLLKTIHEVWLTTVLCGLGVMSILALLTFVLPQVFDGMEEIFEQMPFVKTFVTALLGTEIGGEITARTMQAFLWVHPVLLALIWGFETTLCTRIPAAEIDRGTIDVLFSWPVSRRKIYYCETLVWLVTGILLICMGLLGHRLAAPSMPDEMRPVMSRVVVVMANLFCVYLAVGGIAFLISACSDRRGRAIAIIFALVLASFMLNFVAQFWMLAKKIAFLSVMDYYQPAVVLTSGQFPTADITILLTVAVVTWFVGGEVFARRSICTI